MKICTIVAAAGESRRLPGNGGKLLQMVGKRPLLYYTLTNLLKLDCNNNILVVIPKGAMKKFQAELFQPFLSAQSFMTVEGGDTRQESIAKGVAAVPEDTTHLLIHDGARPWFSKSLFKRIVAKLKKNAAVIPVLACTDTIKVCDDSGYISNTPARDTLFRAQTPQGFQVDLYRKALKEATKVNYKATDDASLLEFIGQKVATVPGETSNLKITHPIDLEFFKWRIEKDGRE
ncbi:2-C-methyl-D-erythritol 4-phosphate cytidylyltransferase [Candidatus Riflebacteria bacterium]